MKKRIDVGDLEIGMFVAELDRPWLESPFLFQGFRIETQDELGSLQLECNYVFIDTERSSSPTEINRQLASSAGSDPADPRRLTADYDDVLRASTPLRSGMIKSIDDRRLGQLVSAEPLKESVIDLLAAIMANPSAALWLTNIREVDELTATHSINVAVLSLAFAHHLGMDNEQLEAIGLGAILHDIGLTESSSEIIRKDSALTDDEFAIIRKHPEEGLAAIEHPEALPSAARDIIRWHHERLDGSGYPDGLEGDSIPRHVRIVALADAYDAMASDRVYRKGVPPSDALLELHKNAENTYGEDLVRTFIRCIGIYPPGTLVKLSSGAIGMVVASREESRLLPVVMIVLDNEGQEVKPRQLVDLAHLEEKTGNRWNIESTVNAREYGLDVASLFQEENGFNT